MKEMKQTMIEQFDTTIRKDRVGKEGASNDNDEHWR